VNSERIERLREIIEEKIPLNRMIGLKMESVADGKARFRFDFKPELVGNFIMGILHGGVISATMDVVGTVAVLSSFPEMAMPMGGIGTVDLRVDYLRPSKGEFFICTGQVMRPGRILSSTRMELYNDQEKLCAIGTAIYRLSREEKSEKISV